MTPSDPFDFSNPASNTSSNPGSGSASGTGWDSVDGNDPGTGWSTSPSPATQTLAGVAGPPLVWLAAAAASGIAAIVLAALLGESIVVAVVAWLLGGPIGIGFVALFSMNDTRQRARAFYSSPASTRVLYAVALALVLIGVIAAALRIAVYVGRL